MNKIINLILTLTGIFCLELFNITQVYAVPITIEFDYKFWGKYDCVTNQYVPVTENYGHGSVTFENTIHSSVDTGKLTHTIISDVSGVNWWADY